MYDESRYIQEDEAFAAAEERRIESEDYSDKGSGTIKCFDCNGTGMDAGALNEPEPCAWCLGAGEFAPGELDVVYDYEHQAWAKEDVYLSCGHTAEGCGCFGRLHAGEPTRRVA